MTQQFLQAAVGNSGARDICTSFDNAPLLFGEIALIPLRPAGFALIDVEDIELVSGYKWRLQVYKSGHVYAQCSYWENGKTHTISMHRLIAGFPKGKQTHHWDDNGLNNRRSNLTSCTYSQNQQYARARRGKTHSKYKGVSYNIRDKKWQVSIRINGEKKTLSGFATEIEAARAYDLKALEHFGCFARTNFNGTQFTNCAHTLSSPGPEPASTLRNQGPDSFLE